MRRLFLILVSLCCFCWQNVYAYEAELTFDSFQKMKLELDLHEGTIVKTNGFNEIGDGGNGIYRISKSHDECYIELSNDYFANYIVDNGIINLKALGIVSSRQVDNYDRFFDIVRQIKPGRILYLPKGYYVVSDCVFLPANTTLMGDGKDTIFYFNGKYNQMGVGLSNGGDNVVIKNMMINHKQSSSKIISSSMIGGIGFSTFDINSITEKHSIKNVVKRETKGLKAIDIWSDSNYILQTETGETCGITDVEYKNINAPVSLVSIYPRMHSGHITNVILENITCSSCRIGVGNMNGHNIRLTNINCKNLRLTENFVWVKNCKLITGDNNNLDKKYAISALLLGKGKYYIDNMYIKGGNPNQSKAIILYSGTYIMNNCIVEPEGFSSIWNNASNEPYDAQLKNCDFKNAKLNIKYGTAIDCKANFVKNNRFSVR